MSEYTLISSITDDPSKKIYRVLKPSHFYVGFMGYLWQVVRGIYKYPNDKYYIYVGNPNGLLNVWDFYFKQPHTDIMPNTSEIISEVGILFDEESEFVDFYPSMLKMTPEERQERRKKFSDIIKKYFQFKPEIENKINNFKEKYFKRKRILGYHHRGTDHTDKQDINNAFPIIDKELEKYDLVFAASDERMVIDVLNNRYKDRIICYNSTTRSEPCDFFAGLPGSPSDNPSHLFRYNSIINWTKENTGYKIGEDVIIEANLLSSTDFLLISSNSNVNYFIRAINADLPYKVIYSNV